ncbi:MAG: ABC transporter substrate-binding protein [Anaerolineae bacterium]
MRRVATLMLVFLLVATLTGCSLGEAIFAEPVVLRFAFPGHTDDMANLIRAFTAENPNITVEWEDVDGWGSNMGDIIAQREIDVFGAGREALKLVAEGELRVFDELLLDSWVDIQEDYIPGTWEALAIGGQQWGAPAGLDLMVTFINKDQLTALDLAAPQGDWSLSDMLELANEMNYPDSGIYGICTSPMALDPIVFIYLYGGRIVDDFNNPTVPTLDEPLTIEAAQWYADLFNFYGVAPAPQVLRDLYAGSVELAVTNGGCAIWFGWYSDRASTATDGAPEAVIAALPTEAVQGMGLGDMEAYYISAATEHPEEAAKFLRFLSDHSEASGALMPPRTSLVTDQEYIDEAGDAAAGLVQRLPTQIIMVPYADTSGLEMWKADTLERVGDVAIRAMMQIVMQDLDAATVLMEAQGAAQEAITRYEK